MPLRVWKVEAKSGRGAALERMFARQTRTVSGGVAPLSARAIDLGACARNIWAYVEDCFEPSRLMIVDETGALRLLDGKRRAYEARNKRREQAACGRPSLTSSYARAEMTGRRQARSQSSEPRAQRLPSGRPSSHRFCNPSQDTRRRVASNQDTRPKYGRRCRFNQ